MNSITLAQVMEIIVFAVPILAGIGFVVRQAIWIGRLEASAKAARSIAEEAKAHAEMATNRAVKLEAQLAAFREHVAREYTSKEAIRELENRLVDAINRLGDRFDKYVDHKDK